MHRRMGFLLPVLSVLLLTSCAMDSSTSSGYMPIPDQFLGKWDHIRDNGETFRITISQTPTEIIWDEKSKILDKENKIHRYTIHRNLTILAIEDNFIYAIARDEKANSHKIKPTVSYHYLRLSYNPSDTIIPQEYLAIREMDCDKIAGKIDSNKFTNPHQENHEKNICHNFLDYPAFQSYDFRFVRPTPLHPLDRKGF